MNISSPCSHGQNSANYRLCPYCAAVRQKQIADKAQRLEHQFPKLFLSVIKPSDNTAKVIQHLRAALLRRAFAPAGLWSVESGEKLGGLHLNIIAPAPIVKAIQGCSTWSEAITTSARICAAYINKPGSFPDRAEYSGNITGSWSRIPDLFTDPKMPATVQAASLEAALSGRTPDHYLAEANISTNTTPENRNKTRAQFAEIARANLQNLYAALAAGR